MIGTTIGQYRITSRLGEGGMGAVFLAQDTRLRRQAAIKLLPSDVEADPARRQRFLTEARAASALNHPHVCVVYDVGETDDGRPFIAMEFVEGQTLKALVSHRPLEVARIVDITAQVADALDAAHASGIIHRDIKPSNIGITRRGQVKVLDFGLAKRTPTPADHEEVTYSVEPTMAGGVVGTPGYMSPEQALGKAVDHRSDLFSLGVVLYELTTGRLPFDGDSASEIIDRIVHAQPAAIARLNYDVPPELERITLKCLQKSPDRRYQSARELLIDLQNLARTIEHGTPDATPPPSRPDDAMPSATIGRPARGPGPFSLESLQSSDVLLGYASIDDYPLQDGKPGWVSQLHRNLEVRMEQLSGEHVAIARLPEDAIPPAVEPALLEAVPKAKAMISVVSPPFIQSDLCRREVEEFWRGAEQTGGLFVKDKSRLLKVVKTAVASEKMPRPLVDIFSPLAAFEFFELDADTGRVREFDETFGPALKQRFFERVYDVAYDACQVLSLLKQARTGEPATASDANRRWVYLATTTSDVTDERDRIKRELLERGHVVLPDTALPILAADAEVAIREALARCTIAIHLLGQRYGVTPEDSHESLQAMQVRLTAAQAERPGFQRLIWMPGGQPEDERQRAFVARVQEDPALHRQAEIIEGNLSLLKHDLIYRLAPREEPAPSDTAKGAGAAPKVYLICDRKDEAAVEALQDYLFVQGLEVLLPAFDGDDADAATLHQENLLSCDAVLVYYGAAPRAWVDIKLRELLKAAGYGRETPIAAQAVYIAPPDDRRKERFQSHQAGVIRQHETFQPNIDLDAFVSQVRGLSA